MKNINYKIYEQHSPYNSPWSLAESMGIFLWRFCWAVLCGWTPKPLNKVRLLMLKIFGCRIHGRPFVHQKARIQIPWNLILHDRACIGDSATVYSLGVIEIKAGATVAQETYLCSGTHDFSNPKLPLMAAQITVGENAFIGARAFVMPGIDIGKNAVIGACSVVTNDMPKDMICAGNPCKVIRPRVIKEI